MGKVGDRWSNMPCLVSRHAGSTGSWIASGRKKQTFKMVHKAGISEELFCEDFRDLLDRGRVIIKRSADGWAEKWLLICKGKH